MNTCVVNGVLYDAKPTVYGQSCEGCAFRTPGRGRQGSACLAAGECTDIGTERKAIIWVKAEVPVTAAGRPHHATGGESV